LLVLFAVKNVVLAGFGHITLLDLDTIDLSNLNRQFLFRKKDVKQSKAMVCPMLPLFNDSAPTRFPPGGRAHSIRV
jgi:molybdopterin/thiamine biosynthesis adenylyltransferase